MIFFIGDIWDRVNAHVLQAERIFCSCIFFIAWPAHTDIIENVPSTTQHFHYFSPYLERNYFFSLIVFLSLLIRVNRSLMECDYNARLSTQWAPVLLIRVQTWCHTRDTSPPGNAHKFTFNRARATPPAAYSFSPGRVIWFKRDHASPFFYHKLSSFFQQPDLDDVGK